MNKVRILGIFYNFFVASLYRWQHASAVVICPIYKADDCGVQRRTPNEDNTGNGANYTA